jgi:NADH-quinone oxidoreductase subunit N
MVAAVIGAFLYLRIMVSMWLDDPASDAVIAIPRASGAVVAAAVVFTIFVGVFPGWLLDAARLVATYRESAPQG